MAKSEGYIKMLHGAGGSVMHDLVKNHIVKYLGGIGSYRSSDVCLEALDDAAAIGNLLTVVIVVGALIQLRILGKRAGIK